MIYANHCTFYDAVIKMADQFNHSLTLFAICFPFLNLKIRYTLFNPACIKQIKTQEFNFLATLETKEQNEIFHQRWCETNVIVISIAWKHWYMLAGLSFGVSPNTFKVGHFIKNPHTLC